MSKTKSGIILIGIGIAMNLLGRVAVLSHSSPSAPSQTELVFSMFMALWMCASVVVVLFGIVRLVWGLLTRKKVSVSPGQESAPIDPTLWPPPPSHKPEA